MADPFALLGIPPTFDLDVAQIEARWRELSRTVHPDRHMAGSAADRRHAVAHAMDLNAAFRIIKDPIKRAEALLAVAGVATGDKGREPPPDMELLMSVMQLRGDLATARSEGNIVAIEQAIAEVRALECEAMKATSAAIAALLHDRSHDRSEPDVDAIPAVKAVGKLRYYRRFLDEARAIVDDVADRAASGVLP